MFARSNVERAQRIMHGKHGVLSYLLQMELRKQNCNLVVGRRAGGFPCTRNGSDSVSCFECRDCRSPGPQFKTGDIGLTTCVPTRAATSGVPPPRLLWEFGHIESGDKTFKGLWDTFDVPSTVVVPFLIGRMLMRHPT